MVSLFLLLLWFSSFSLWIYILTSMWSRSTISFSNLNARITLPKFITVCYPTCHCITYILMVYRRQMKIRVINVEEMSGIQCTKTFTTGNKLRLVTQFNRVFFVLSWILRLSISPGITYSIYPAFSPPVNGREYLLCNVRNGTISVL